MFNGGECSRWRPRRSLNELSYLQRRYILLEKLQDFVMGKGEGGGGRGEGVTYSLGTPKYMITFCMMLRKCVTRSLIISAYRRAPKKKIHRNTKFSSK